MVKGKAYICFEYKYIAMLLIELDDRTLFLDESEVKSLCLHLNVDSNELGICHYVGIESPIGVKLFELVFEEQSSAKRAYKKLIRAMKSDEDIKSLDFRAYK